MFRQAERTSQTSGAQALSWHCYSGKSAQLVSTFVFVACGFVRPAGMEALALCCWPCVPKRTPETGLRGSVLAERCRKPGAPKLTRRIFFCTGMRCVCREAQVTRNEFLEWEEATTEKTTPKNPQNQRPKHNQKANQPPTQDQALVRSM